MNEHQLLPNGLHKGSNDVQNYNIVQDLKGECILNGRNKEWVFLGLFVLDTYRFLQCSHERW